jgi:Fe-S oxidoreductase
MERITGFSALRPLPEWQSAFDAGPATPPGGVIGDGLDLVLYADPFNRYFEPENLHAAQRVLRAAGYRLHVASPSDGKPPLSDGRTFLAVGAVEAARHEARRVVEAFSPFIARGARVVGLEPSSLLTFRDEYLALLGRAEAAPLAAASFLVEEVLAADLAAGRITLPLRPQPGRVAHLHGHCHQKAAGVMAPVEAVLKAVPGLELRLIESGCCGMAGSFGYEAEKRDISLAMAELSLLPAVRAAAATDWIIADGTSCRHQIADGSGREAVHVVRLLDHCLESGDARA